MKELLSPAEARELNIINLLYNSEKWWKIEDITKEIKSSVSTVRNTIVKIKENSAKLPLDNSFDIMIQKNRGIYLKATSYQPIAQYESNCFCNSLGFQLLNEIFHSSITGIEHLAKTYYVSVSTIYRKLKEISAVLKTYKLDLSLTTFEITGNELWIREFFFWVYWRTSDARFWPFLTLSKEEIAYRYNKFKQRNQVRFSVIEEERLLYRLAINFIRISQKNYIPSTIPLNLIDPIRFNKLNESLQLLAFNVPVEFKQNEIRYYHTLNCSYPYFNLEEQQYEEIVAWHRQNQTTAYQLAVSYCEALSTIYHKDKIWQTKLLFHLISLLIYKISFPFFVPQPENTLEYLTQIKAAYPKLYEENETIISTIYQEQALAHTEDSKQHTLFISFILINEYLDLAILEDKIYIQLYCSLSEFSEKYLREELQARTKKSLIISTSHEQAPNCDLIITDSYLVSSNEETEIPIYYWKYPPATRDWQNILSIITNLS